MGFLTFFEGLVWLDARKTIGIDRVLSGLAIVSLTGKAEGSLHLFSGVLTQTQLVGINIDH
jgi:hypothetical protein